jgi:DNA-binding transcriptional LysR family regulator
MNFSLTDLNNFQVSASSRSLVEASKKLSISQPALSESIKKLEIDLGEKIFYRSRNGIELTPSGRALLPKVQGILNELKLLKPSSTKNIFNNRVIKIGAHATVASYTLPMALKTLEKVAPDYKIDLIHSHSRHIQAEVQRGRVDIGIVVNPIKVPDLVIQNLSSDEVGVWGYSKNPKLDTVFCDLDLAQTQIILKKWKMRPDKVIGTNHFDLISRFVAENLGVGILPKRAAMLSQKKIYLIQETPLLRDELALIYRPEFGKNGYEKLLIESIKKVLLD